VPPTRGIAREQILHNNFIRRRLDGSFAGPIRAEGVTLSPFLLPPLTI